MAERPHAFTTQLFSTYGNLSSMYRSMCFKECILAFLQNCRYWIIRVMHPLIWMLSFYVLLFSPFIGIAQDKANLGFLLIVDTSLNFI